MGDIIAGLHPGTRGGSVVYGRDHFDHAVLHGHFDAQAAELTLDLLSHVFIDLRWHIR